MIDVSNCCDSGGGAGVEAPQDWQQIQNDQKCILHFTKIQFELLEEYYLCLVVMVMDTV